MLEVKVIASTVGALIASVGVALLNGLVANSTLLGGLPPWMQFVILTIAAPVVAFLSGYQKTSETSDVSDGFKPAGTRGQY